jgi:signal transduction histidine kinase/ActR/RegA family two-component response regulator
MHEFSEPDQDLAQAGADHDHVVQFYEDESFLHGAVATFLAAGLRARQPLLVIATPQHRKAFVERLASQGFDPETLERRGDLTLLDARETLSTFMNGLKPDDGLFHSQVGGVLERIRRGRDGVTVRAYGEMVDVLWRDGNPEGAIRLERLWNELATAHEFSLLCGYAMGNFYKEAHSSQFQDICHQHGRVIPTESYTQASDDEMRLREISRLQQRARALENEIQHRKELEQALRRALAERERAEAERERLLAQEQAARAEAEAAGRLKDEFLAVLSHELRTPLNAILGWTHIVTRSAIEDPTMRRALEVIQRNAALQLHVIDDLLDVSRIVTGKMLLSTDPVDLAEIVTAAVETVRPAAAAKELDLKLTIESSIGRVKGDRDRLQQVLWNLLSNAVKFTPNRGRVDVRVHQAGQHVQIVVRDTGPGIAPEFLPRVFDRFRQADTGTTRKHGGLGLGLAVVRYLVEAHGGTVAAESPGAGLGATFTVRLPVPPAPLDVDERPAPEPTATLHGVRVLLVDDEEDARELFRHVLGHAGAAVETAASVEEALRVLSSERFDVLVGDIGMPDRDGYALIDAIRSHPDRHVREMRAIAVTSYAGDHYRARAISAGYDEYISKPVEPGRLAEVVADLVRQPS